MVAANRSQTALRRPPRRLITRTTKAITSRMWIRPPPMWRLNPRSHKIPRITKIVQSIFFLPEIRLLCPSPKARPTQAQSQFALRGFGILCKSAHFSSIDLQSLQNFEQFATFEAGCFGSRSNQSAAWTHSLRPEASDLRFQPGRTNGGSQRLPAMSKASREIHSRITLRRLLRDTYLAGSRMALSPGSLCNTAQVDR